jgi:AP endonuclease-1
VNSRKRIGTNKKQQEEASAPVSKEKRNSSYKTEKQKKGNKAAKKSNDAHTDTVNDEKPAKRPRKKKLTEEDMTFPPRVLDSAKRIGGHVSTAKGIYNAVLNARLIGANAFQIFVRSQRKWESKPTPDDVRERFIEECKTHGYTADHILVHGSYLMNLAHPDPEKYSKSYAALLDEVKRTEALGLKLYNFHPGSTTGQCSVAEGCSSIAKAINKVHKDVPNVVCVVEIMAGGGNTIGGDFKHLKDIIEQVENKSRVGVCLDTCHMFAAGYDIRSVEAWKATMKAFEQTIGLKYLRAMHLNDSKTDIGSHRDRHENLGKGFIKWDAFSAIVNDPRTDYIPMVLETPVPKEDDKQQIYTAEIAELYRLAKKGKKTANLN